jgi:DNA-binding NarL/FixJ family response regulator
VAGGTPTWGHNVSSSLRTADTGSAGAADSTTADPGNRIRVVVQARDPISQAGAISHLRRHPVIDLRDEAEIEPGTVAVLIDEMPDVATITHLRRLVRGKGARAVLVVSTMREAELLDVIECGVGAVVWRHEAAAYRLMQAVLAASRGDGALPADLLGRLLGQVRSLQRSVTGYPGVAPTGMTAREADVLRLVAEGLDTDEIAGKLSYSAYTVKNILHGLNTRLHLRNRAHAVAHAVREGYI